MKGIFSKLILIGIFLNSAIHAGSGPLFLILSTGPVLIPPVNVTICINPPLSCQNYILPKQNYVISPSAPNVTYPNAQMKINTPGYQGSGTFVPLGPISASSPSNGTVTPTSGSAPSITSSPETTFVYNTPSSFKVTATGSPSPVITYTGALPAGLELSDSTNGTANIVGSVTADVGTYTFTIIAANSSATATQSFTLTVAKSNQAVMFTSTAPTNVIVGSRTYTPTGTATSGLAVAFTIDLSSAAVCSINNGVVTFILCTRQFFIPRLHVMHNQVEAA